MDETHGPYWCTLRRIENSRTTKNLFASIEFSYPPEPCHFYKIAVGPKIFFIPRSEIPSSSLWILDTRSGELRRGPSMLVKRRYNSAGLVGGKIYVIGGCRGDEIPAEAYDLKTQTWEAAPIPEKKESYIWIYGVNVSLDRKVYAFHSNNCMTCYNTRDGSYERSELPNDEFWPAGLCVIDNVLYVYFSRFGLMWYDSQLMLWRVVYGLDLGKAQSVGMAEYNGKLAFLWESPSLVSTSESNAIWLRMIGLARSEVGIQGSAEPSQLLGIVPRGCKMHHCLSLSG